jgi:hypothetical protein
MKHWLHLSLTFSFAISCLGLPAVAQESSFDPKSLKYDPNRIYEKGESVVPSEDMIDELYIASQQVPANTPPVDLESGVRINADYWSYQSEYTSNLESQVGDVPNEVVIVLDEKPDEIPTDDSGSSSSFDPKSLKYDPNRIYDKGESVVPSEDIIDQFYIASQQVPANTPPVDLDSGERINAHYWSNQSEYTSSLQSQVGEMNVVVIPLEEKPDDLPTNDSGSSSHPSIEYTVNLLSNGGGSVNEIGIVEENSTVELIATPYPGWIFREWTSDSISTTNPYILKVTSNVTFTATFAQDSADDDGDGLTNYQEQVVYKTNSSNPDTDGDGLNDNIEISLNSSPTHDDSTIINYMRSEGNASGVSFVLSNLDVFGLMTKEAHNSALIEGDDANATPYTSGWFWQPGRGWMIAMAYPYIYDINSSGWLYFKSGHEKPTFYDYKEKSWITISSE